MLLCHAWNSSFIMEHQSVSKIQHSVGVIMPLCCPVYLNKGGIERGLPGSVVLQSLCNQGYYEITLHASIFICTSASLLFLLLLFYHSIFHVAVHVYWLLALSLCVCSQTSPSQSISIFSHCSFCWAGSCGHSLSTASIALSFTWNHQPITTTSSHFTSSCMDNTTR